MKAYIYPSRSAQKRLAAITNRALGFTKQEYRTVEKIIEDVTKNGDAALLDYTARFDGADMTAADIRVTDQEMAAAAGQVDRDFIRALDRAIAQIKTFHEQQRSRSWINTDRPGTLLGQMIHPVDAAGIYVPGGQSGNTPLVSSVLMGAIPAGIAGVKNIVMATPPTRSGAVNPHLLTAARKVGVHAVYKVGSAWAVAALACGTATIPKVDVIVGPGNVYVTLAKKILAGAVGIDMIAGPSEILIIADKTADPEFVAADMLSQAEHDILASSVLLTDSRSTARAVIQAIDRQITALPRHEIAGRALEKFGAVVVVPDIATAIELANRIAPEHLELQISDPFARIGEIRNAGAVFLGRYTPEAVGDYIAGPNHVLPTAGTARFSSALSVSHFTKKTSLIQYSETAFTRDAAHIMRLAKTEGLEAHAHAVAIRLKDARKSEDVKN